MKDEGRALARREHLYGAHECKPNVDEVVLSAAPTFLVGKHLFDGIDPNAVGLDIIEALASSKVTHLRYAVKTKRYRGIPGAT